MLHIIRVFTTCQNTRLGISRIQAKINYDQITDQRLAPTIRDMHFQMIAYATSKRI